MTADHDAGAGSPTVSALDLAIAIALTLFGIIVAAIESPDGVTLLGVVLPIIAGVALARRRCSIVAATAVVLIARLLLSIAHDTEFALGPAATVAVFTLSRSSERSAKLFVLLAASVAISLVNTIFYFDDSYINEAIGEFARMLAAIAIGDAIRTRGEQIKQRIDTEAASRVQAERLRIARDLHDVVAHGLSTISVQSGVAAHLIDIDPDNARQALEAINTTGKRTLEELRSMVGVLRSTDETPLRPTPTDPDDLTDLIESAERAGLRVTTTVEGAFPPDVSDACVVAMHRITQEALTNVVRHAGPVGVTVQIRHTSKSVRCRVVNEPGAARPDTASSTGVGVIGMTERAHSIGGSVHTGPTPIGGFAVLAELPYRRSS